MFSLYRVLIRMLRRKKVLNVRSVLRRSYTSLLSVSLYKFSYFSSLLIKMLI
jgi:hypothetical protein